MAVRTNTIASAGITALGVSNAFRLRRMDEQKTRAQEMIRMAREMCVRAAEMRKPPRITFPR